MSTDNARIQSLEERNAALVERNAALEKRIAALEEENADLKKRLDWVLQVIARQNFNQVRKPLYWSCGIQSLFALNTVS